MIEWVERDRVSNYVFMTGIGAYSTEAFELVLWYFEGGKPPLLEVARRLENRVRVAQGVGVIG